MAVGPFANVARVRDELQAPHVRLSGLRLNDDAGFPPEAVAIHEPPDVRVGRHCLDLFERSGLTAPAHTYVHAGLGRVDRGQRQELRLRSSTLLLPHLPVAPADVNNAAQHVGPLHWSNEGYAAHNRCDRGG